MQKACPCSICQQTDHLSRHCPELRRELETGFYKPSGGHQGGGEGEDETLTPNYPLESNRFQKRIIQDDRQSKIETASSH